MNKSRDQNNSKRIDTYPAKKLAHRKAWSALLDEGWCRVLVDQHLYKSPYAGFEGPLTNYATIVREFRCPQPKPPFASDEEIKVRMEELAPPRDQDAEESI